jgi:hypothetical protein
MLEMLQVTRFNSALNFSYGFNPDYFRLPNIQFSVFCIQLIQLTLLSIAYLLFTTCIELLPIVAKESATFSPWSGSQQSADRQYLTNHPSRNEDSPQQSTPDRPG